MTFVEPQQTHGRLIPSNPNNVYQGRWRLWYSQIADELMKDPQLGPTEIAKRLGKSPTTIKYIVNTDLFRDYLAQRRTAHTLAHDQMLRDKLGKVAEAAMDNVLDRFEKQKDRVPLNLAADLMMGSLEKLGYGAQPKGPQVAVQVNNNGGNTVQVQPAALSELEQARATLRAAEEARRNRVPIPAFSTEAAGVAGEPVRGDAAVIVGELMEDIQGASNE